MAESKHARYEREWRASVQEKVPDEEVLAVGVFARSGSYNALAAGQVSGLASMLINRKGKQRSGGLPSSFMIAATPTTVLAFAYKPRGTKIKVKDEVGRWSREGMTAGLSEGKATKTLTLRLADGQELRFDIAKMASKADDAVIGELTGSPAVA